jgi:hypothetical protein
MPMIGSAYANASSQPGPSARRKQFVDQFRRARVGLSRLVTPQSKAQTVFVGMVNVAV